MRSARLAHCAPAKIAGAIVAHMPASDAVAKVEVAGPGFINFYLNAASSNEVFRTIREQGEDYGRSDLGHGTKVQVEFVSANPVGPLHIGHGRWAALGDSLSRILEHAGYDVEREYYINDHGSQMDVFGHSVSKRYLQLVEVMEKDGCDLAAAREALLADREAFVADEADEHPETHPYTDAFNADLGGNAYGGDYIVDLAVRFHELDGLRWADATEDERMADFRERGYQMMLESIRQTCHEARCDFDVWFSERSLYVKDETGSSAVDRALAKLDELGYLYKDEAGALWFRSTDFGDDKDRVLIKTNGEYTYFASDVAYHWNKFQRVDHVIDIWGADHHGYIQRVKSACTALGLSHAVRGASRPAGQPAAQRPAGAHVQAQGHHGDLRRAPGGGRCRRNPLHACWRSPTTSPSTSTSSWRQEAGRHQPGLLRAVRARPHLLHPAQGRRRLQGGGGRARHGRGGQSRHRRRVRPRPADRTATEAALCPRALPSSAGSSRAAPATVPRSASPTTPRSWRRPSTRSTRPARCSRARAVRWRRGCRAPASRPSTQRAGCLRSPSPWVRVAASQTMSFVIYPNFWQKSCGNKALSVAFVYNP